METLELDQFEAVSTEESDSEYIRKGKQLAEGYFWEKYAAFVPEEIVDELYQFLENRDRGWIQRLRVLDKLKFHIEQAEMNRESLLAAMAPRTRKVRVLSPLERYKAALQVMDEANLRQQCKLYSVSYNSYMNSDDKAGLIDAILIEYSSQE